MNGPAHDPPTGELRALVQLALPLAIAQAGQAVMGFVDVAVVGRVNAQTLAGVGLGNGLFFTFAILGMGIVMGVDPLISQALGARDADRARHWMWQAVWVSGATSLVLTPFVLALPWALSRSDIPPDVVAEARTFLFWRTPGLFFTLAFFASRGYLQAVGRARTLVVAAVIANLVNFVLDVFFVYGGHALPPVFGPLRAFPALGSAGAALATDFTLLAEMAVLGYFVAQVKSASGRLVKRAYVPVDVRRVLQLGVPVGLHMFLESGFFTIAGVLAARMGKDPGAAHQIALQICSVTFTFALGIGSAGSVRVGYAVGAGDPVRARHAGLTAFGAGATFMACSALALLLLRGPLTHLMTHDPNVLRIAVPLMLLAALFQLSDGTQGIGAGVLRGAGDTRFTFIANLLGHYGVGLPVALVLVLARGKGVEGIWWAFNAGLTAVGVLLFWRFWRLSSRPISPAGQRPG